MSSASKDSGSGGARVSEVHANFIVHDGDATSRRCFRFD